MPARIGAVQALTQQILGPAGYARGALDDRLPGAEQAAAAIVETVVGVLFGPAFGDRVLEEATARHAALHPDGQGESGYHAEGICADCLRHAALNDDGSRRTAAHWTDDPDAPTPTADTDWPALVAGCLAGHRRAEGPGRPEDLED